MTHKQERPLAKRKCFTCGQEFETPDAGRFTATICTPCGQKREAEREEEERRRAAAEQAERDAKRIAAATIPLRWKTIGFSNSKSTVNAGAFRQCQKYAEEFSPQSGSLYLWSHKYGTGKTHLAICIANYLLYEKRLRVRFQKARDLLLDIKHTYSGESKEDETMILRSVLNYDLLILDDVGVDPASQWIISTYWTLFDRRLEQLLPVIVTANFSLDKPEKDECLGDRIGFGAVSRLRQMCRGNIIEFTGPDLR